VESEIRKSLRKIGCFLVLLGLANPVLAQTDVYLKVYTKTFQRMTIDLYPFEGATNGTNSDVLSALITEVLKNDLWMSGYFSVSLRTGQPATSNSTAAKNGGAIARLGGTYEISSRGVTMQPSLVDNASGKTIIRSGYTGRRGNERRTIHRIADDVVYSLTGERGTALTQIAYVHQKQDGVKELAVMDYDGHNARILTSDKSIALSPAWSPDGRRLCYTSYKDERQNLYVINLATATQFRISNVTGLNSAPAWSPDGAKIAMTLSKDGNAEIYLLDVEKKRFTRLTYNRAIDSSPTWSPSNREIAFTSDRSGSPQIYIMGAEGLNIRRLTYEGSYNDSPTWSPRGDKIAYVSRTESGFDIYTIDAMGENQMRLTDSSSSNEDPYWAPNGFSLTFSSSRSGRQELYSMFWDGSDQKKITSGGVNYMPAWSPRLN